MSAAPEIVCPAGLPIAETPEGPACMCRIESTSRAVAGHDGPASIIKEATSPVSFRRCSTAPADRDSESPEAYTDCRSWRAEWLNRKARKLTDEPGKRRTGGLLHVA